MGKKQLLLKLPAFLIPESWTLIGCCLNHEEGLQLGPCGQGEGADRGSAVTEH